MYDRKTQLLIKNPIKCYLINSPMLPAMNKDANGLSRKLRGRLCFKRSSSDGPDIQQIAPNQSK